MTPVTAIQARGLRINCPKCGQLRECVAISPCDTYWSAQPAARRRQYKKLPEVHFFLRARECTTCYHNFTTCEVSESILDKLVEDSVQLRELTSALGVIKKVMGDQGGGKVT
jgi:hypothetical protein